MIKEKTKFAPNKKQQECIDTLSGPVMVLAGPGTGKTFTTIERVKNMLNQGIEPSKILCLTFSDAAAGEMKKRLVQKIGNLGSRVNVYTYHSFCFEIIQNNPDYFEELSRCEIINDTQKRSLIRQCLDEIPINFFKTASGDKFFWMGEILYRIDEIKKNLLNCEQYFYNLKHHPQWQRGLDEALEIREELIANNKKVTKKLESQIQDLEKKIGQAHELWAIFELYTLKMRERGLIDFNDMIAFVLMKFAQSASFADKIAKEFDYFLVDEYQDTNNAQNSLIFSLIENKKEKNIFVVGDDDQIIFGFQGAQIDNIERFLLKYPQTKVICLQENMRSTQSILDLSEQVAQIDPNRLQNNKEFEKYEINKHLVAKNSEFFEKNTKPQLKIYEDLTQEYNGIVDEIENIIKTQDPKLSEIAILTKTNSELEEFYELLHARNIPCELKDGKSIFSIKASILTIFYLKMLENHTKYASNIFPLLLSKPFCININDYNDLLARSYLHKNRDFIGDLYEMKKEGHNFFEPEKIDKFLETFEELLEAKGVLNPFRLTLEVINKTGILNYFANEKINREENIQGLKRLTDEAKSFIASSKQAPLSDFIEYLDDALENNTPILTQKPPSAQNAIQLITLHSSKGREFEYVFMPTLEEYKWERAKADTLSPKIPTSRIIREEEKEDLKTSEKIKLLFVGITRAKHKLYLSAPKKISGKEKKLTRYISQIDEKYLEKQEIFYDENNYTQELLKSINCDFNYKEDFQNFIRSSIENLSISASMLNTYTKCPRMFLYSYVLRLNDLYEINDRLNYGNVIHKTIENFSKKSKSTNCYLSSDEFLEDFKFNMSKTPFSSYSERNALYKKGSENLLKFYNQLILTPLDKIYSTEQTITAEIGTEIKINGKIDRLELNDDGSFRVIDFKTGSAKSHYAIKEGGVWESYLTQLKFYKYLIEKKYEDKKVTNASLVFVEQCEDNYHADITNFENEAIEEKIKAVHKEICEQNFEPTKDKKACQMCPFSSVCELNLV